MKVFFYCFLDLGLLPLKPSAYQETQRILCLYCCNVGTTINNEKVDIAYCFKNTVKKKLSFNLQDFSVFF